jgi:DNA-binding transcriptional ArsR family regulator
MSDDFFKAISDANRRAILKLLRKQHTMTAGAIAEHFAISKAALSEHLKVLRNADLVVSRKQGQFVHYSLNTSIFEDAISWMLDLFGKEKGPVGEDSNTEKETSEVNDEKDQEL